MAPCTRQQKRLGIRVTRAKAKTKEYRFSLSSSSSSSNSSKRRCRATTKKKQSPPPPNTPTTKDEDSKVAADHNNSKMDGLCPGSNKAKESNVTAAVADHNDNNGLSPGLASYIKYFSVPEDLAIKYYAQLEASDGFDVDDSLCGYRSMGGRILPIQYEPGFSIEGDKDLHKYAKKALASFIYKNKNEKNLKFHRVVKANQKGGPVYWWYYITFEATDAADNQIKTLQAEVSQKFTGKVRIKIESCRLKPIPTPTSAPEADRLKPTPTPTSTSAPEADMVIL